MSPSDSVSFSVPRVPPSPNKLHGMHWAVRAKAKALWIEEIRACAGSKDMAVMRAWSNLEDRIRVQIIIHHSRLFDPDNMVSCAKVPLDAAKYLGIISDDSHRCIELEVSQEKSKRREARTEFKLSRIE